MSESNPSHGLAASESCGRRPASVESADDIATSADASPDSVPAQLIQATVKLLAEQGPSAIKARAVASETGLSTMVVYHHFVGIAALVSAVIDHGYVEVCGAFSRLPVTDDPIADLFALALTCRRFAHQNPHWYDLMFGLTTRATYRPVAESDVRLSGRSLAFQGTYAQITGACARLADSGRVGPIEPGVVAAALWSYVHGYIALELADRLAGFDDPVAQVMVPTGVTLAVGLGDTRERAAASHTAATLSVGPIKPASKSS